MNGKCYGTELHRLLNTALTPLQKALNRLEKGGVLTSYYEGKTRLYQFNPAYPLLAELEQLLKKTYTLLPAQIKRSYYLAKEDVKLSENKAHTLLLFWERLSTVTKLSFHAKTKAKEGWNGKGKGKVTVTKRALHQILFQEKGNWQNNQAAEVSFTNTFRWTLDEINGLISLEHLRYGPDRPVFLFHLVPNGKYSLASVDSHLCEGDTYFGQIRFDTTHLRLHWRVIGPKKNEEIDYYYS